MANLPAKPDESSELDSFEQAIVECLAKGMSPAKIAKYMHPEDKQKRKNLRARLWRMVRQDNRLTRELAERAQTQMALDLVPAVEALGRRAKKGRPDAIKLLMEASGFHNPRVKHEHSGDIKITLNSMPRPDRPEVDDAIDAEVVED